ncbi:MAG: hypothetical protein AB7F43_10085 [Bacteriovoracia bacterium]
MFSKNFTRFVSSGLVVTGVLFSFAAKADLARDLEKMETRIKILEGELATGQRVVEKEKPVIRWANGAKLMLALTSVAMPKISEPLLMKEISAQLFSGKADSFGRVEIAKAAEFGLNGATVENAETFARAAMNSAKEDKLAAGVFTGYSLLNVAAHGVFIYGLFKIVDSIEGSEQQVVELSEEDKANVDAALTSMKSELEQIKELMRVQQEVAQSRN